MGKRVKYRIGDVFIFDLENGLNGVGRVIKKNESTIFIVVYKIKPFQNDNKPNIDDLVKEDVLLMEWCYDTALKKGIWEIIGNIPVEENFEMPYFYTDSADGKYYLIKGGDTHLGVGNPIQVSKEEAQNAYSFGITNEIALPKSCIYLYKKIKML